MTELLPRIKSGWLRATLFFIAAFIYKSKIDAKKIGGVLFMLTGSYLLI